MPRPLVAARRMAKRAVERVRAFIFLVFYFFYFFPYSGLKERFGKGFKREAEKVTPIENQFEQTSNK